MTLGPLEIESTPKRIITLPKPHIKVNECQIRIMYNDEDSKFSSMLAIISKSIIEVGNKSTNFMCTSSPRLVANNQIHTL